jgi:glucokinase
MQVLAGDIGGTKTRLAIFETDGSALETLREETFPSRAYDGLEQIAGEFLERGTDCDLACFGVAGPVRAGRCRTTNLPWEIDADLLRQALGMRQVSLLNDLEANAWGIAGLGPDDFASLNPGAPDASGNGAIIAAGTGLGQAGLFWDGERHRPFATEGGHTDFAPGNELEQALLTFLQRDHEHVSWERVVSGPGLVNLHRFLREHLRRPVPAWLSDEMAHGDPAAAISRAALAGDDPLCAQALDLFVHFYGVEAGNQALKLMASGGVYIGGGIAPKILPRIQGAGFMLGFTAKGRMRELLEAMPVRVILNDRTALFGPALYASQRAK